MMGLQGCPALLLWALLRVTLGDDVPSPAPSLAPTGTCGDTCLGATCDFWVERYGLDCDTLEDDNYYACDCSACACAAAVTTKATCDGGGGGAAAVASGAAWAAAFAAYEGAACADLAVQPEPGLGEVERPGHVRRAIAVLELSRRRRRRRSGHGLLGLRVLERRRVRAGRDERAPRRAPGPRAAERDVSRRRRGPGPLRERRLRGRRRPRGREPELLVSSEKVSNTMTTIVI